MIHDSIATFDAELLTGEGNWHDLAELILRLPDSFDDEKGVAAAIIGSDQDDLDWGPILSLILTRILLRRVEALEERLTHRAVETSGIWLVEAIAEGDHEKAERAARVAFSFAQSLTTEKG